MQRVNTRFEMMMPGTLATMARHMTCCHSLVPVTGTIARAGPMIAHAMLDAERWNKWAKGLSHATKGIDEGLARNWGMALELELRYLDAHQELFETPPYLTSTVNITLRRSTVIG